jgi:hypothetical protein
MRRTSRNIAGAMGHAVSDVEVLWFDAVDNDGEFESP